MTNNNKFYIYLSYFFIALSVSYLTSFVLFSDFKQLIYLIPDDSSYYLKIAKNFSEGSGFTFDGINATNGFQPLWQLLLIPFYCFIKTSAENYLRIILIFQIVLIFLSEILLFRSLLKFFKDKIVLIFVVFFTLFVFFNSVNGMETSLMVFLISVLFTKIISLNIFCSHNRFNEFKIGMLLGLLILSRLDLIFFAFSLMVFIFLTGNNHKENLSKIVNISIGFLTLFVPYLFYNYISFGNIIPISGYLKSGFSNGGFIQKVQEILRYRETYFALISIIFLGWFIYKNRELKQSNNYEYFLFLAVFSLSNFLLLLYLIFFLNWVIFYWYFIPFSLFFSLFICIPINYIINFKIKWIGNLIYFSLIIFIVIFWGSKLYFKFDSDVSHENNWNDESYIASQWVKQNTNSSDVFAMKDAGHFGYFSERNTVNLDGLVNNFEYQEVLKDKHLNDYLKNNKVKYFVQHAIWDRDDITSGNYDTLEIKLMSHKYSTESDPVKLFIMNEVYRSDPYYDGDHKVAFIIWKLEN